MRWVRHEIQKLDVLHMETVQLTFAVKPESHLAAPRASPGCVVSRRFRPFVAVL